MTNNVLLTTGGRIKFSLFVFLSIALGKYGLSSVYKVPFNINFINTTNYVLLCTICLCINKYTNITHSLGVAKLLQKRNSNNK